MSFTESFQSRKAEATRRIIESNVHTTPGACYILLKQGQHIDDVNEYLSGRRGKISSRSLDIQILYQILGLQESGLSDEARAHLTEICDQSYGAELPAYVDLERTFDPWDYLLCYCPTENHFFNDTSNRLAETIAFPDRTYSDGRTAADYRPYWEDAFRKLVDARISHGMREWRSPIYCHVIADDCLMIYNLTEGPTREAARAMLDYLWLTMTMTMRKGMWTGPHSRVYNKKGGCTLTNFASQCYMWTARFALDLEIDTPGGPIRNDDWIPNDSISCGIIAGDYVPPEAVIRLMERQDRYANIETVGPRYHPAGLGEGVFNPAPYNPCLCTRDRDITDGKRSAYTWLSPRYGLGSVQDWGDYGHHWHMHCSPWSLMIASGESTDIVTSFTGSEEEMTPTDGGYMMWGQWKADWDGTIFQHRKTLFCQLRGHQIDIDGEWLKDGYPEAPGVDAAILKKADRIAKLHTRFYIADSIGECVQRDGWIFGEKSGVCFAIRTVRGGHTAEPQSDWIPGKVFVADIWDDVVLMQVAEIEEIGSFEQFQKAVLSTRLSYDDKSIQYVTFEGDEINFCWKEDGLPTVNGTSPDYAQARIEDPCVHSENESGVITVKCDGAEAVIGLTS